MKIRRDIASVPHRSAKATWQAIVELIRGEGSVDVGQLHAAASVMEALIAEEHPNEAPIVVKDSGPQLVIYLKYDRDAMALGDAIEPLSWNPTDGDWAITAPTAAEDVDWMNNTLADRAPRIRVHDVATAPRDEAADDEGANTQKLQIDWSALSQ